MTDEPEALERAALEDMVAACPPQVAACAGLAPLVTGTAFACVAGGLPASAIVVNRTIGLGTGSPASREELAEIVAAYRSAGAGRWFIHLHPEARPWDIAGWLEAEGMEPARGWQQFARGREAPPEPRTDLDTRPAGPADADAFGRIAADAFDVGPDGAAWLAALVGRPGWHVYMSFDGERPAGTGTMFVRDGLAWLDWGATAAAFRGRGGQSAVLARRIADALDLGCRAMFTETGEDVPGDPQHSWNNIVRAGFAPSTMRPNYAPPRP